MEDLSRVSLERSMLADLQDEEIDILEQIEIVLLRLSAKDRTNYARLFSRLKLADAEFRKLDMQMGYGDDLSLAVKHRRSLLNFREAYINAQSFKNAPNRRHVFDEYEQLQDQLRLVREQILKISPPMDRPDY